ncbi:unnamed protein product [Strongylus vulgaris]|uniref:Tudor-knot domain-containing protein n=1 Tax=Strongylus vulgaris TaxID=40348 RepID=A0A3P7ILT6_STRVU|nr:unnamed protein product [Strongylus vulgaris]
MDLNRLSETYYVHYKGWNKRYDEWITEKSIVGPLNKGADTPPRSETPKVRHSKREKKTKKPVDWSPANNNVPVRNGEKFVRKKNNVVTSKAKRSPLNKNSKQASSISSIFEASSDEGLTSDEEEVDPSTPRSYIDLLARARKRAERKRERREYPQETVSGKI